MDNIKAMTESLLQFIFIVCHFEAFHIDAMNHQLLRLAILFS